MKITFDKKSGYTIVHISVARLDVGTAPQFKDEVSKIIKINSKVILDLSEVPFIDSTGLGTLLSLLRQLAECNGALKLTGLTEQVMTMFLLVRMNKVFDIYSSNEEAEYEWKIKSS